MASFSSSLPHPLAGIEPPSTSIEVAPTRKLYDVFINHHGPDVKKTLATKLYDSLKKLGIRAFLDAEELELGDHFPSEIKSAISSAYVQIAIMSKGYAASPWCLAELVLMVESKARLIPIFYDVLPSDLHYIKGEVANDFSTHRKKGRHQDKLNVWEETLKSIAGINGYELSKHNNDLDELCKKVVSAVQEEAKKTRQLHVAKYPVGLVEQVEEFESFCRHNSEENNNGKIVGIYGMGGLGKTTLAKEFFNRMKSKYGSSCFLYNVREASVKHELTNLQTKLLQDLFEKQHEKFNSVDEGIEHVKSCFERGSHLSFLIILDDINHVDQLDALVVRDELNSCSLVIVTTRDEGVLKSADITLRYKMKEMNRCQSSQLFCRHAFGQPNPASGFEALVERFVTACGGLPLSLKVLGSHVRGRTDQHYWESELDKIRRIMPEDIKKRLQISFDALDKHEKQIFMDIACFFIGKETRMGIRIWEGSGWSGEHAIQTLKDKCLVEEEVEFSSLLLRMHDHLRDLGRELADEMRSPRRIWRREDVESLESRGFQNVLTETNVRCLYHFPDDRAFHYDRVFLGNARYSPKTVPLWLQLSKRHGLASNLSRIPLQNVQVLTIYGAELGRLWQSDSQAPSQLKELRLRYVSLEEFPYSLGTCTLLENLVLKEVSGVQIEWKLLSDSLRKLTNLKKLRLHGIKMSGELALNERGEKCSLETIKIEDLEGCSKVSICGDYCPRLDAIYVRRMESLIEVNLSRVTTLKCLILEVCNELKRVSGRSEVQQLVNLDIFSCPKLEELSCLASLNRAKEIAIEKCGKLQNIKGMENVQELGRLSISYCPELVELPSLASLNRAEEICIEECGKLQYIKGMENLQELARLSISYCPELVELPSLASLKCAKEICIVECGKLQNIKGMENLQELGRLSISYCPELVELPSLASLNRAEEISIEECGKLQNIKGMENLQELARLRIYNCPELVELPSLNCLGIADFQQLQGLRSIVKLQGLRRLCIRSCPELEELPCLASLNCLETISIEKCGKLQSIRGLEELQGLRCLEIIEGNEGQLHSIQLLERLPEVAVATWRAGWGAESALHSDLFEDVIAADAITQICTGERVFVKTQELLSAIIICALVHHESIRLPSEPNDYHFLRGNGEWIVTIVMAGKNEVSRAQDYINDNLINKIKKGYMVRVEKGEEGKSLYILKRIIGNLVDKKNKEEEQEEISSQVWSSLKGQMEEEEEKEEEEEITSQVGHEEKEEMCPQGWLSL